MKRYLIVVLVISVLVSVFLVGCSGVSPSEPKASDYEQRLAKLEQQMQELTAENRLQPRTIEKDIETTTSEYSLPFDLKVGDRVEGEVSFTSSPFIAIGDVKDPYGNQVVVTLNWVNHNYAPSLFPWRFAFIAATDGAYKVRMLRIGSVNAGPVGRQTPSAHEDYCAYE